MKVIAVLEDDIAAGGAFNQALNAILQMQRVCKGRFDFEVLASSASGRSHLGDLGIDAAPFSLSLFDKLFLRLGAYPWWRHLQRRLRLVSAFERQLLKRGCDLVYFVRQSELSGLLQRLNFIATLFDLCHRDTPEFPEVREFGEFWTRERYFSTHLTGATLILADSPALAAAAAARKFRRKAPLGFFIDVSPLLGHKPSGCNRDFHFGSQAPISLSQAATT